MLIRLATVAILTLVPLTGEIASVPMPLQALAQGGGYFPRSAIADWSGQRFTLIRIDSFDRFESERASLERWIDGNPDRVVELQATIRQNRGLESALRARGVRVGNIGAVREAFNGNLTVYLE